jgi:hypothetical protein
MPDHTGKPRNPPARPSWFDKWKSLENFVNVFAEQDITIIADGVDDAAWDRLNELYPNLTFERTQFGSNAGAFLYSLEQAIKLDDNTVVYFVEDDYVHHEGSDLILEQGLSISPYVSLYDHPDKYWNDNASKPTIVTMSEDCHWRTTGSTTMTFGARVRDLKEDRNTFYQWCGGEDKWTHDFQLFTELSTKKNLITPLPGYATHCDSWVVARMVDWEEVLTRTTHIA